MSSSSPPPPAPPQGELPSPLPAHVAIIMDGNGRWAQRRGLPRLEGHRRGADSVRDVVRYSRQIGLRALTLYAFSSQNWSRPAEEVAGLMQLLRDYVIEERNEILDNDISLCTLGDVSRLPPFVAEPLAALCAESAANRSMILCLALSYGGRESIVETARGLAAEVGRGALAAEEISEELLSRRLGSHFLPPLDLMVRTSGELRLSNFLLWEAAYAELYFTDTLWPDFSRRDLWQALVEYGRRERRFGKTSAQLRQAQLPPEEAP